jgi:N utilization substance protein A
MAALVVSGAPVSVLIDHGLAEKVVEKLIEAGIGTVEKLGAMTPEQLEEIPGIGPKTVEAIQIAVNGYYAQFEDAAATAGVSEGTAEAEVTAEAPPEQAADGAAEEQATAGTGDVEPPAEAGAQDEAAAEPAVEVEGDAEPAAGPPERRQPAESGSELVGSDTIKDSD